MTELELRAIALIEGFDFRWPDAMEHFDRGWEAVAQTPTGPFQIRHGLAMRIAYGRPRVRSVTWVNKVVAVEGVEANDYPTSRALVSIIRTAAKRMVRVPEDVPMDVRDLDAPYSRDGLAVKLQEDDLERWAAFAISRTRLYEQRHRLRHPCPPRVP